MKKNKLVLLLLLLVLVASMYGCGSNSTKASKEVTNAPEKSETSDEVTKAPDKTEDADKGSEDSSADASSKETTANALPVENSVIFDQDGFKVTSLSLKDDDYGDKELKLNLENNSDKEVTYQITDLSVNGYMTSTLFSVDVTPGKKAEDVVSIYMEAVKDAGVKDVESIEFKVLVFDKETYATIVESDVITLTTGVKDSKAKAYDTSGETVYDENNIKIVAQYLDEDDVLGSEIMFYIENNSDSDINVSNLSVSVNGTMAEPLMYCDVAKGKKAITGMSFTDLKDKIKEAELSLEIMNADTSEVIKDTDPISITFE